MSVYGVGAVVVQDSNKVGQFRVLVCVGAALEIGAGDIENDAIAGGDDIGADTKRSSSR